MAEITTKEQYDALVKNQQQLEDYNGNDITPVAVDTSIYIETAAGSVETLHDYHQRLDNEKTGVVRMVDGKIPSDLLPSYVDDVIEGFYNPTDGLFYSDAEYTKFYAYDDGVTVSKDGKGEAGKIYIDKGSSQGDVYRWVGGSGTTPGKYVLISDVPAATLKQIDELRGSVATLSITNSVAVFVGSEVSQAITATSNVTADSMKLTLRNDGSILAQSAANPKSISATVTLSATQTAAPDTKTIRAEAVYGDTTKTKDTTISIVDKIYAGAGATAADVKIDANARKDATTNPSGTYNVTVSADGQYVFFIVPQGVNGMRITKATLSGFDFPLENADETTYDDWRVYKSKNTYKKGTLSIVVVGR